MAQTLRRAVLVSAPGLVQKATISVLASCPELDLVATVPGALSATRVLTEVQPDILLIDATLVEGEAEELLGWVKTHLAGIQCVAMTVTSQQSDLVLSRGADAAIHRSDLTNQLAKVLGCLPGSPVIDAGAAGAH